MSDLQKYFPQHEYHLYTPKVLRNKDTELFFNESKFIIHESKSKIKSFWRSYSIVNDLKMDKIEIYHGLSAELPFGIKKSGIKSVVTIHDLIFKFFPSDYKYLDRIIYEFKTKFACNIADQIISISEYTSRDIVNSYGIDDNKINVIYLPLSDRFSKEYKIKELEGIRNKFNLPSKFFLYVGSVNGRKNLKLIINSFSIIDEKQRIPLVVVGNGKKYMNEVKNLIQEKELINYVIFLNNISNEDLPKIYRLSKFFVFPSVYEGFGLPVLEAIQSGTPVIVSDDTSLVEVAGDCGVVLPKNKVSHWAESIKAMSIENTKIKGFKENCTLHLKQFDPKVKSIMIMDVYNKTR